MLHLPDSWVWDFWLADDGAEYHLYFLFASRALHDPQLRHERATIGHAVSTDLVNWRRVADAVVSGPAGAFDEVATWTGSVVHHPDGTWFLFYTGAGRTAAGARQTVGYATSTDLTYWHKAGPDPVLIGAAPWYQTLETSEADDDCFRDPWVFADPDGDGWHMLLTAKAAGGPFRDSAVIGHATSLDLRTWQLRPPLSAPGQGFSQYEVPQVSIVDGRPVLLFSCFGADTAPDRAATGLRAGVWAATGESPLGPFDLAGAHPLTDESLYSGRLVRLRGTDEWRFLAFRTVDEQARFAGEICDPIPVEWVDGRLALRR